jgi:four helix bundle protein
VYKETQKFPLDERFGLTRQLRRSAVSIPANIAEGFVKRGVADKLRYLNIAQGSLKESRYYLIPASDLGLADLSALELLAEECSRTIEAFSQSLRRSREWFSLLATGYWLLPFRHPRQNGHLLQAFLQRPRRRPPNHLSCAHDFRRQHSAS